MNSMTAFSRFSAKTSTFEWVWELKSVNHRYLDQFYRLPDLCRSMEGYLRQNVVELVKRGRIDINLQLNAHHQASGEFNLPLIRSFQSIAANLAQELGLENDLKLSHYFVRPEFCAQAALHLGDEDEQALLDSFKQALATLLQTRQQEGASIAKILANKVDNLGACLSQIRDLSTVGLEQMQHKLKNKLEKFYLGQFDESRFEQELVYQLMRIDITEEIDRLSAHIQELKRVMADDAYCGRRLDFLVQECHRETNTMGAKTDSDQMSQIIIEMKVIIEQLREQIQNVE